MDVECFDGENRITASSVEDCPNLIEIHLPLELAEDFEGTCETMKQGTKPSCRYWDYNNSEWSTDGLDQSCTELDC